jgi:putative pyruvate formate lyase activating enzyme
MTPLIRTLSENEIADLIRRARENEENGRCCPRNCGLNRYALESAMPCGADPEKIIVASFHPHKGEEPPVSGENGAGNIFVSGCTLACVFCQNYPFSHLHNGRAYNHEEFCDKIRSLMKKGVHNLNITTFDHYTSFVLGALSSMRDEINIPISNNCSGYFSPETLEIMISFCDIFLYDLKYASQPPADKYSGGKGYAASAWKGAERLAQIKVPWIEEEGLLKRGVIFRHLVLPGAIENTLDVLHRLDALRDTWSDFRVSLMSQYFPAYRSSEFSEINRKLTEEEYEKALELYDILGFEGWVQELSAEGNC